MSLKSNFEYIRDWCNHRFLRRDEKVDVDLSNYYTKDEVDSNISSATPDISVSMYSSSGSKSYNQTISNNGQFELSRVATSGSYNDLSDKPTIPAAQVQSDWNATSGMGVILNKPDLSGYMTVEDYQTDEEVVAAALNDLDGRIKTVAEDVKANSTQKGMHGQISRDKSSGYLAVNKKPTTLGDKILIDPFIFPLGNSNDYNLAVVGNYNMYDHDIEGIECDICLRIRGNNGGYVLPTGATLYIHPMGSSDNPERAYEIAAVSSEEIVVRYHGGDEIYRFTINDPQLYSDGVYIPLTKTFVNDGSAYNRFISEEILESQELAGRWGSILTVDLAIPQTIAEAEMDEYGSLIWKTVPTLSDNILRDTAGKNYIPTNKAVAYHTKNFTRRFETEYVRGEDDIAADGSSVVLGDFSPAIQYQDLKAGDIVDVSPKEEDITNVIFRNNGTESIRTQVYYASQDRDNFVPGTSYHRIKYERIADFPSDSNTQMSSLVFYKGWSSEDGAPVPPYFVFQARTRETESGVTSLGPFVGFVGFNSTGEPVLLNSDYVGFIENESSSHFFCTEVVINREVGALTPKRQDDGVVSILDYYKFYYVAEGKTYVMSRDGNYVRPLDITKDVVEQLREKVMSGNNESESGVIVLNPDWKHMPTTRTRMTEKIARELLGCSEDDLYNILKSRYSKLLVMFNDEEAKVFYPETEIFTIVSGEFVACNIRGTTNGDKKLYIELSKSSGQYVYTDAHGGMR